jgi:hypothetical protein
VAKRGQAQRLSLRDMQDDNEDDDYEYQEGSNTFNAMTMHGSDNETHSEDIQELYKLSSDMAIATCHQLNDRPAWRHDTGLRDTTRSHSFYPSENTNLGGKRRSQC